MCLCYAKPSTFPASGNTPTFSIMGWRKECTTRETSVAENLTQMNGYASAWILTCPTYWQMTQSTILCKWKQNSVISSPYICILLSKISIIWFIINPRLWIVDLHQSKVYYLLHCIIRREWQFWFDAFSDFPIEIFNKICGLDYFPDFQKELEENSQVIPIVPPFYNRIWGVNLSVGYIF